jgi:phosphoribosylformylglycinamidine synthase
MKIKFGTVVFPGSNCDRDAYHVTQNIFGKESELLWHKEADLKGCNVIILPGGFSYGDYVRSGAIAKVSPIMKEIVAFANKGGIVLGICNGFQILLESGLLPGVMLKNKSLKFISKDIYVKVTNKKTFFTSEIEKDVLRIPIAHAEGNYFAEKETINELAANEQIVFQYSSSEGIIDEKDNPNGSIMNIAGIINKDGNVLGMMPHPERCADERLGNTDGAGIFKSIIVNFAEKFL